MSTDLDDTSRKKPEDADALKRRLRVLMGEDALAYLDLNLPERESPTEAHKKHAARTARYKQEKALQMAPDSAAVQQAVSFAVFGLISRQPEWSRGLFEHSIKELHDAGYDAEESKAAFLRLLASVDERRTSWQRRSRQRLAAKVIEQLRALQK